MGWTGCDIGEKFALPLRDDTRQLSGWPADRPLRARLLPRRLRDPRDRLREVDSVDRCRMAASDSLSQMLANFYGLVRQHGIRQTKITITN